LNQSDLKETLFGHYPRHLLDAFKKFHKNNPHIYKEFCHLARKIRETGREKYSAKMIINVIRWNHDINSKGDSFKVNDKFQSLYGRLFVYNNPEYLDFFNFRNRDCAGSISPEEHRRTA